MNTVLPLTNPSQLALVDSFLVKHYNSTIVDAWRLGLQLTLRITDLLSLKYSDVVPRGNEFVIELIESKLKSRKVKRKKVITLNAKAMEIVKYRRVENINDLFIFQSHARNVKKVQPITRGTMAVAIKEAGEQPAIQLPLGTHTMRKTRALHIYKETNDIALVMELLNHTSMASTLRYLGITQDKVQQTYNMIL